MEKYEVIVRNRTEPTGNKWSLEFQADDFAHAEEQAKPYLQEHDEIITIYKDYA